MRFHPVRRGAAREGWAPCRSRGRLDALATAMGVLVVLAAAGSKAEPPGTGAAAGANAKVERGATSVPEARPSTAELVPRAGPIDGVALRAAIDAVLGAKVFAAASVGVLVVDLETRQVLYDRDPDRLLNPASNVKLFTTAAALEVLGPEHRFATRVQAAADTLKAGVVHGDLYLVGGGDPQLVTEDLMQLAADLHARGVRRATGGLVVDATLFDRDELPPGYDAKEELAAYRVPTGAMTVNFNTFTVRVRPGAQIGERVTTVLEPPVPGVTLRNEGQTVAGSARKLGLEPVPDGEGFEVRVRGTLGVEAGGLERRFPVLEPSAYAGAVFRHVLKQQGIRLGRSDTKLGKVPPDATTLAMHASPPVGVQVRAINKLSNNFMAEQLLKLLDERSPKTYEGALARLRGYAHRWASGDAAGAGAGAASPRIGNGSGLYDRNRVSARQLVGLLRHVWTDFRLSADFIGSLAVMGADGTTRSRLAESPARRFVRAKTGTLDDVSCLSGYAGFVGRAPIVFAILMNGLEKWQLPEARAAQDRLVELALLAVTPNQAAVSPVGPAAPEPTLPDEP